MGTVTLPGVDMPGYLYDPAIQFMPRSDGSADAFFITEALYEKIQSCKCEAFLMIDSNSQRRKLRDAGIVSRFFMGPEHNMLSTDMVVHQFKVTLRPTVRSSITGGCLLGFESLEDAVLFKLTHL